MNPSLLLRTAALSLLAFQSVPAVTINSISYETRPYTAGTPLASAAAYASNWATLVTANPVPPAGYGATLLSAWTNASNQVTFSGSGTNIAYHARIDFTAAASDAGTWDFRFGIDFGLGGAFFLDGVVRDFRDTDMWWSNSYSSPAQILAASVAVGAGAHTIDIYGSEACCDGVTEAQYRTPGGSYQVFAAGAADPVPEPSALALSVIGLAVCLAARRRRQ